MSYNLFQTPVDKNFTCLRVSCKQYRHLYQEDVRAFTSRSTEVYIKRIPAYHPPSPGYVCVCVRANAIHEDLEKFLALSRNVNLNRKCVLLHRWQAVNFLPTHSSSRSPKGKFNYIRVRRGSTHSLRCRRKERRKRRMEEGLKRRTNEEMKRRI